MDCCFTVAMQEADFRRLKSVEETLAYKVSKCTFASYLAVLSNVEKLHNLVFLTLEVRTTSFY